MKNEMEEKKSRGITLPGILTGLAAVITAISGCIAVIIASPKIMDMIFPSTPTSISSVPVVLLTATPIPDYVIGPDGGPGGVDFQDKVPQDVRIGEVVIHTGNWIDSIQIVLTNGTLLTKHGGTGGDVFHFQLAEDEYITAISGRYGNFINTLTIETNTGRLQTFGKMGGGTVYKFVAPPGSEIIGFVGRSGEYVDAIGVIIRQRQP